MPKTIRRVKVESAARVIAEHARGRFGCACGLEWSPLHVSKELAKAGLL